MEVKSAPKLWDGAYSTQERYTQEDAAVVIEHARLRGVRVMVEFDMPGPSRAKSAPRSVRRALLMPRVKSRATLSLRQENV